MKITNVEAFVLESPYENRPPAGSDEAHGVKHCLLLKVSTDEGLVGWSDVETAPHVAAAVVNAPTSGAGVFEGLRSLVVGEDPFEVERLWDKIYRGTIYYGRRGVALQVLSGFDIACHDLMGKATDRPLHKLLGGARRDRVRAYASTLFRPTPDAMRQAGEFYMSRGFTAVKFGWGVFGQDRKQDIALVAAAREALGPDAALLVDPGWVVNRSAHDAVELCRALEPYDVFWLEDFLHPECYDGYAKVKAAGPKTRLAAGEQEATAWGFRELIARGGIDVAQPDLTLYSGSQDCVGSRARRGGRVPARVAHRPALGGEPALQRGAAARALSRIQCLRKPHAARNYPHSRADGRRRFHSSAARAGTGHRGG